MPTLTVRPLLLNAFIAALFGALAIAESDSWWVAGAVVGAFILLVLAIVLDASRDAGSETAGRRLPIG